MVYIASLPHSGSTLLSLLLAKHPGVVALGEVRLQIDKLRREPQKSSERECGCGLSLADCPLWGAFLRERTVVPDQAADLLLVDKIFHDLHGAEAIAVDASKIREPIDEMAAAKKLPLKIIHLSRDYRSWIVSANDLRVRKRKGSRPTWLLGLEGGRRWRRENRKLECSIAASGFSSVRLGYEELVLSPARAWSLLWDFLALPPMDPPSDISGACNHIFSGNRMRKDAGKCAVSYDGRWFGRRDWVVPSIVFPLLARLNTRWVYSHGIIGQGSKREIEKLAASHGFNP